MVEFLLFNFILSQENENSKPFIDAFAGMFLPGLRVH